MTHLRGLFPQKSENGHISSPMSPIFTLTLPPTSCPPYHWLNDRRLWKVTINLQSQRTYNYRFVVCKDSHARSAKSKTGLSDVHGLNGNSTNGNGHGLSDADCAEAKEPVTIYKWETNFKPRVLTLASKSVNHLSSQYYVKVICIQENGVANSYLSGRCVQGHLNAILV